MKTKKYGVELQYIQSKKNMVADALSRLLLQPSTKSESNPDVKDTPKIRKLAEAFLIGKRLSRKILILQVKMININILPGQKG